MELTQLKTLVYVAELGSLSKAADSLCTAQPALSRHVRLLEQDLGVQLFDRHGRGMVLTEKGKVVLQHAKRVLHEMDDIRESVVDRMNALDGEVSIGLAPTVSELLAAPLLVTLKKSYPDATFRIVSSYSLHLLQWIYDGSIDVAILYDPKALRSLKSEPFMEEDLYVVASASAHLDAEQELDFAEVAKKPLILPSRHHSLRDLIDAKFSQSSIDMNIVIEANSYSVLKQLVLRGIGWTILPLGAVQEDVSCSKLSYAPLSDPPRRMLELAFPTDRQASLLATSVRRAMIEVAHELVANGTWPKAKMLVKPSRL